MRGLNRDTKRFEEENIMKKEDFVALGISEELAEKAAEKSAKELKGMVPRDRLNEVTKAKEQAEASYNTTKEELEKLKNSTGDSEAMKAQIKQLQDDLKDKDTKHAAELADMKMTNAIQAAIGGTAQDVSIVSGLLDKQKLILTDDGKVTGLDEQIKSLKESKPFLFKGTDGYPDVKDGGEPGGQGGGGKARDQFADWLDQVVAN